VKATTELVRVLNTCMLVTMLLAAWLERRTSKQRIVVIGSVGSMVGFIVIILGGVLASKAVFYTGVTILGLAIGLATVSNLSLMLDMTRAGQVGLFIGAWGMAESFARLSGDLVGGIVRDLVTNIARDNLLGYLVVFGLEAVMLLLSLLILRAIDVKSFQTDTEPLAPLERVAMASE
jgi:BCD family chlorophyll transporter-like MFS transporter